MEMLIDSGHCIGHGSGTGPVVHDLKAYCKARGNGSKGYLCLIDWLPDSETYNLGDRLLQAGMTGADVTALQTALKALGADLGDYGANNDGIDGEYGNLTKAAVLAFEQAHGLTPDGVADIACIKAIHAAVAALAGSGGAQEPADDPGDDEDDTPVYPVRGIIPDISSNQGKVDLDKLAAGNDFAIFRVLRGNGLIDSQAVRNMAGCQQRGFPFHVYHFFKPRSAADAKALAVKMYALCHQYDPEVWWLDVETLFLGVSNAKCREYIKIYVAELRALGVEKIGIYMGDYRWRKWYSSLEPDLRRGLDRRLWQEHRIPCPTSRRTNPPRWACISIPAWPARRAWRAHRVLVRALISTA